MLLAVLADFYLDALRKTTGNKTPLINTDQARIIEKLAKIRNAKSIVSSLRRLSEAEANLARNAHIELTLETMFIQLSKAART